MTTPDETLTVTTQQLADLVAGTLDGPSDLALTNMAPISGGSSGSLTFIRDQAHAKMWAESRCSAALVSASVQVPDHDGADRALIVVEDADIAFAKVLAHLDPGTVKPDVGIHPHASVHPTATVDQTAAIGPGCTVGPGATIGPGSVLIAGVHIGAGVSVGAETVMHPGVVLCDRCTIGARGLIHPNVVIGADGFGFIPPENGRPAIKVPQIGFVQIGDDVEIGAGSTIDRAKIGVTVIGSRVKLDNLVHIGHNCDIGDDAILCGRTTLGGSSLVGAGAMVGGAVVVSDQTAIGAHAKVAGGSMVLEEVPSGETYAGIPAMPARKALANHGAMRTIADFVRRVDKTLSKLDPDYSSRGKR